MILSSSRRRGVALALGCGLLLSSCASQPPASPPASAPPAAEAAPAPAESPAPDATAEPVGVPVQPADVKRDVEPMEGPIPFAPPDGKWLVDEQGRPYFVHRIKKIDRGWVWEEEGKRVKLLRGLVFDVVDYDDTSFRVKIYGMPPGMAAAEARRRPSADDKERAAASYVAQVAASDRLRFVPWSAGLPTSAQWRNGFAVADMNGDGELDIAHGPPRKGGSQPVIFLGDGKGRWRRWAEAKFPALPFDYGDAAAADLNGDGHVDLVLASHLRGIVAMLGNGRGEFTPWSEGIEFAGAPEEVSSEGFTSRAIEIVDWNGDSRPDILALGEGPRMAAPRGTAGRGSYVAGARNAVVYLNQGDGKWKKQLHPDSKPGVGVFGDKLAVGDFNADGRLDFLTASAQKGNRSLLHLGSPDGSWEYAAVEALRPVAIFRAVGAGDFDRDGRLDLTVGFSNSELGVLRTGVDVLYARDGSGWERRALGSIESNPDIWSIDTGDLDGDGALDIVAVDGTGLPWVFLGDGKGSFSREASPDLVAPATGCTGYHLELVDLDRDGADEIIVGYAGEGSQLLGTERCTGGGALRVWRAEPS